MDIGQFDQKIEFLTPANVADGVGGFDAALVSHVFAWAKVWADSSDADVTADRESMTDRINFQMHRRTDLTEQMKISWNGRMYKIVSLPPVTRGSAVMTIIAASGSGIR